MIGVCSFGRGHREGSGGERTRGRHAEEAGRHRGLAACTSAAASTAAAAAAASDGGGWLEDEDGAVPAEADDGHAAPPEAWPRLGALEFRDVRMRYRPGLPLALDGLSFRVAAGARPALLRLGGAPGSRHPGLAAHCTSLGEGSGAAAARDAGPEQGGAARQAHA